MFTNTYLPHLGGVAESVDRFTRYLRDRGHEVLIVCPQYDLPDRPTPPPDDDVVRVPAIQHISGTDFAMALPLGADLSSRLGQLSPQIIHSHHPFLLGNSAIRAAALRGVALVFTHHTMYEHYTHYIPGHPQRAKSYVAHLACGYANLTDRVLAPSESTAGILRDRGVQTPISVVPTGVEIERFSRGDGQKGRRDLGIAGDGPLLGHVGRLAQEKNLRFLARATSAALADRPDAQMVIVGDGPMVDAMREIYRQAGLGERVTFAGVRKGQELVDAYHAMDAFVFASRTETQGMVLVEAMASGAPVVALDAPGAREVLRDGVNGALVRGGIGPFAAAVKEMIDRRGRRDADLTAAARQSAQSFSLDACGGRLLEAYRQSLAAGAADRSSHEADWDHLVERIHKEWQIWANRLSSLGDALSGQ